MSTAIKRRSPHARPPAARQASVHAAVQQGIKAATKAAGQVPANKRISITGQGSTASSVAGATTGATVADGFDYDVLQSYLHTKVVGAPTVSAGAAAGASPPAPQLGPGAVDTLGTLSFGTGSGTLAAGVYTHVTFSSPFGSVPVVGADWNNSAGNSSGLVISAINVTAAGFDLQVSGGLTASQGNTHYGVQWTAIASPMAPVAGDSALVTRLHETTFAVGGHF